MGSCHDAAVPGVLSYPVLGVRSPMIALVGQPNTGKSTLFNLLTGLNQHVGNWPGKTVEYRAGNFEYAGHDFTLVDLPGTYSLTANSPEELIAREFILLQHPSVVVAVVNAANLEKSLYLVAELVALNVPVIAAVNMMDVAEQEGIRVKPPALEEALGLPVIPMIASKAIGVRDLLAIMQEVLEGKRSYRPNIPGIRADHRQVLIKLEGLIAGNIPSAYPPGWVALKLLEGDVEITRMLQDALPAQAWEEVYDLLRQHEDAYLAVASGRYEWIGQIVQAATDKPNIGQIGLTDRLDRWLAHPILGMFCLALILGSVFGITFILGTPVQRWLGAQVINPLGSLIRTALSEAPAWLQGMIVNGLLGGVGAVLTFLPIMVIFFATFAVLEDTGYMARAAYVMDNLMHIMGLHGKSFLPLFLGFGCNVPAVMGTRVIDSKKARLLTILLTPLVPCTARLAVIAFLAPAFFGMNAVWVSWGLVLLALWLLILCGLLLNRIVFNGERSAFIMEMPLYHIPNLRTIGILVWQRTLSFIKKAGTTILAMSLVVWMLSYLPGGSLNASFLAQLGRWLEPVGRWMGFDWRLTVALITSFPAKENVIATLGVLLGNSSRSGLASALAVTYSPASALSFLVVTTLFIPCMATVAVTYQETHSWRWTLLSVFMLLGISVMAGGLIYHLAVLLGL